MHTLPHMNESSHVYMPIAQAYVHIPGTQNVLSMYHIVLSHLPVPVD